MQRELTRSSGIDLARSIAIISVLLLHSGVFYPGRFGVQLFFMISGYLLADLSKISNRNFLIKRAFRLFPLYWVILVFFYQNYFNSLYQVIASAFLLQSIHWNLQATPGSWSISNEWIFSIAIVFLRNIKKWILVGLIVISWMMQILSFIATIYFFNTSNYVPDKADVIKVYINILNPIINIAFFLIGVGIKRGFLTVLKQKFTAFVVIIIGMAISNHFGSGSIFVWPLILWAVFSICLNCSPKSRIIRQIVEFIGKRTYGIFFIHFIVLVHVTTLKFIATLPETYLIRNIAVFATTFLISLGLSEVSWKLIELPSIKISIRVINSSFLKKSRKFLKSNKG